MNARINARTDEKVAIDFIVALSVSFSIMIGVVMILASDKMCSYFDGFGRKNAYVMIHNILPVMNHLIRIKRRDTLPPAFKWDSWRTRLHNQKQVIL